MLVTPRRWRRRLADRYADDRAVVLAWFALMLTVLIGMAGFATDLAYWYLTASRAQNAADAAALGGVVFMPGDMAQATSVATDVAKAHGFSGVTIGPGTRPNQLRVTATKQVDTLFVRALGINNVTVSRSALAEYEQPVAMGSPDPNLGNDPDNDILPQYWLNVAGPQTDKSNGDRYATKRCGASGANEHCSTATTPNNAEYSADGYFFGVKAVAGETLRIQLWDGSFYAVGDTCGSGNWPTAAQLTTLATWYPDAASRYVKGLSKWCSGDQPLGSGKYLQRTTIVVRAPDDTDWIDTDNPVISTCTKNFPGFDISGGTTIYQYLHPSDGVADAQGVRNPTDGVLTFAETFRQWATVCDIPTAAAGEYIVQIRANTSSSDPLAYDSSVDFGGHNRFSMRAGKADGATNVVGAGYVVQARGRLPIYANNGGTNFKAARVVPSGINRTLELTLYDIGDATGSGTLYFTPSTDANISTFSGCSFKRSDGVALTGANPSNCSVSGVVSGSFNGKIVTVSIPIPASYNCNASSESGCWVNVFPDFTTASPTDTTTWSANMLGTPVRLVE
ncbi:MAG: pilus assembly protein TadG-related protein [Acidimicrobiales bacterium]